jgi:guanine deaminase
MYEAMRTALYVSHAHGPEHHADWLSSAEVLRAATEGSARALGFDRLGRIAKGYKADIVFLDFTSINLIPLNDPVNQIVQTEDGRSVHSVMVDGRIVVANGALVGADMARLAADAEAARDRLDAANQEKKALFAQLAPVVGSYCPSLGREPFHIERHVPH